MISRVGLFAGLALPAVGGFVVNRKLAAYGKEVRSTRLPELDTRLVEPVDVHHGALTTSDGGSVHYIDTSPDDHSLPTVVLCHGISAQWWVWAPVISALRMSHRVIAWDMRGHGRSAAGSDGVSIPAAARDIAELLTTLDLHTAVLVGHSMGGMELARFLVDHTNIAVDRLTGALLLSTSGRAMEGTVRKGGWVRSSKALNKVSALGKDKPPIQWKETNLPLTLMRLAFGDVATHDMVMAQVRCQNEFSPMSNFEGGRSIGEHDVLDRLKAAAPQLGAKISVTVMTGSLDRLTPPLHGRALAAALPFAAWVELPRMGHNLMVEDPDSVIAAIKALGVPHIEPAPLVG
jgi:pimeloyl-ACP methyl ester carboxylesterase